ncbi:MAG: sigma-70 family RNA polymerase sigma factor [Lachnospiraceae bacterium]|nr:sigma-70 family RNA polymerase sigma factor [Lachnospiraceae bacterium]
MRQTVSLPASEESESDDALILRLRDGEEHVTECIMNRYKDLVRYKAGSMYLLGADREDLIQEGMIGLFKAIRDYDVGRDASFSTFAELCISRQMYSAVEASGRKKHMPLNTYISLYDGDGEGASQALSELAAPMDDDPEARFFDRENERELEEWIDSELSPFEKQVLDLAIIGMSSVEAARILNRSEKASENALQRAKAKLKRLLETKKG